LFEASMYTFVFLWSPSFVASDYADDVPFGIIFSLFMVMIMIGSSIFSILVARLSLYAICAGLLVTASASLSVALFLPTSYLALTVSFCLFEVCCGVYFPCIGMLRGLVIPEQTRSAIMNFFRVPLNILVVFALLQVESLSASMMHFICAFWLVLAAVLVKVLKSIPAVERLAGISC